MKTQISNLINGSNKTIRDNSAEKYAGNPVGFYNTRENTPKFGGTPLLDRMAIAKKVGAENPGDLHIIANGVAMTLTRHDSTTGKSWSWNAQITAEEFTAITGKDTPVWSHKGANNTYSIYIAMDCTVTVYATSGRKEYSCILGEEFVTIVDDDNNQKQISLKNTSMTNADLLTLLSFDQGIESVNIISEVALKDDATFILAELQLTDGSMTVPFVHYKGEDWLFTPSDWQEPWFANATPSDVEGITWRINDTDTEAMMLGDQPRIAPF